jgi:ABC-2 type transport system ATP-binding protein
VLELVGLADHVKKFPGHLSHGMAKRTGLAQAFIGSPDVVLLDEPTAGLDPFAAKQIRDLIASMRGERTVVVSSHNLAEIQDICTDVALIHQGQIIKHGDIDSFTEKDNQLRIQIRGGVPPVPFFQGIETSPGVRNVAYEPHLGWMTVNLLPDAPPADEVIKMIVGKVFELGLSLGEIQRGTSLEDVFMQLTGHPGAGGPAGYGPAGGYGRHAPPGSYGGYGGPGGPGGPGGYGGPPPR